MTNIRIMTFNVRGSDSTSEKDGLNAWPARAALNVATINRYAPDTIGFQEVQSDNWQTYLDQLPDYERLKGPEYANEEPFGYPSIFWKASRFQLLDSGGFWLSPTPDRFSAGWDTQDIRSAAWVRLRCTDTGLVFTHWNTHLDNKGETARVEATQLILKQMDRAQFNDIPRIMTADFNSKPGSEVHQLFLKSGFVDTFLASGNADDESSDTFHSFEGAQYRSGPPIDSYGRDKMKTSTRMDWILLRHEAKKTQTNSCLILRDHQGPIYPSDHYPVLADLTFTA